MHIMYFTVLDGYDNLATESTVKVSDTVIKELTDLNLETKLSACTVGSSCDLEITLKDTSVYGIYKVTIYGPTADTDINGWTVSVKTDMEAPGAENQVGSLVACDDAESTGKDSFTFTCKAGLAAQKVLLKATTSTELAEVIVAGHLWGSYPCPPGHSSAAAGTYTMDASTTCQKCEPGTYQDLGGQKFCRPSKYKEKVMTDENFGTYKDLSAAALAISISSDLYEVHDLVVYNINFDDYLATHTSPITETADGSCAATLNGYKSSSEPLCVLQAKGVVIKLMDAGGSKLKSETLFSDDRTGTSRRAQTYSIVLDPPSTVKKIAFSKTFLMAELVLYGEPKRDFYTGYTDEAGATAPKDCTAPKVSNDQGTSCVLCPEGKERKEENSVVNCVDCEAGKYREASSTEGCVECSLGSIAATKGLGSCTPCEPGTYGNADRQQCEQCAVGSVTTTDGETQCIACDTKGDTYYAITAQTKCEPCDPGKMPNSDRSICEDCAAGKYRGKDDNECLDCPELKFSGAASAECTSCELGKVSPDDRLTCDQCDAGKFRGSSETVCKVCPENTFADSPGKSACDPCPLGEVSHKDRLKCDQCDAGKFRGSSETVCKVCPEGTFADSKGKSACDTCPLGQESNIGFTSCEPCKVGMYRGEASQTKCVPCEGGTHTDGNTGQSECIACSKGKETKTISGGSGLECVDCEVGYISAADGTASCTECPTPEVSLAPGQHTCSKCELGQVRKSSSECHTCEPGTYNDDQDNKDGECKECDYNHYTDTEKSTECKKCPQHKHSGKKATACEPCDDEPDVTMKDKPDKQWQKCVSDLGAACEDQKISGTYGEYTIPFMRANKSHVTPCLYDTTDPIPQATFTCTEISLTESEIRPHYKCIKTPNTAKLENLLNDKEALKNPEKASSTLKQLTSDADGSTGIGDVSAAADLLGKITEGAAEVNEAATSNLVDAVSSLAAGDLTTDDTEKKQEIANKMVDSIKKVAKATTVANKLVKSANIAIMKVKKDPAAENKGLTFSLPDAGDLSKIEAGGGDSAGEGSEPPIAIQSTVTDMAVVLLTTDAFFPAKNTAPLPKGENKTDIKDQLWNDLKGGFGTESEVEYVNSVILEIDVGDQPPGFILDIFVKPNFQIGDAASNIDKLENSYSKIQIKYLCGVYRPQISKWVSDSCDTVYDSTKVEAGVVCRCSHNTSFAVLMAAEEIAPGYLESQTLMSQVLLTGSIVGLIATVGLILPASTVSTTRSAKVNICFAIALLLASTLFLLQDVLVKADNSGVIKLKSIGCAVYAMLQHYFWLVVFMWTMIEGFLMYLSLVQVFGSHISMYMLKFNAVAYGVPIVFPLAGYFAFTRTINVAGVVVVDHQYLAETMCFLKPGTINFYALFFAPLVLAICVNLVFFALVLKVIKNSKNANLTDTEQLMRQMKAALGVMVLLGTGWILGVFMNIPEPSMQVTLQYLFIAVNASQGIFVFVFYVLLNDGVKKFWRGKFGLSEPTSTSSSSSQSKAGATRASTAANVYANASVKEEEHAYASAAEFPAKRDDNANL